MKIRQPHEMLTDMMLVKHLAGSKAYGTSLPTSDTDIRGVFCCDKFWVGNPWFKVEEVDVPDEEDTKFYELTKFMKLLVDQNPNIVETLWVDESAILQTSPAYEYLRSRREDLLSTKIAFTFSGYAVAQLKRIKGHNKWITNPQPVDPPRQIDFISLVQDFTSVKRFKFTSEDMITYRKLQMLIPYGNDIFGMYSSRSNPYRQLFSDDFTLNTVFEGELNDYATIPMCIIKFNKAEYKIALEKHKQYWQWKNNRNVARSELEEQFGYDTKHAMHLVRLLRMGTEILSTGQVNVLRPDAKELLEIRDGKWSYDELLEYATKMDNEIRGDLYTNSDLRPRVDVKQAADILVTTRNIAWKSTT